MISFDFWVAAVIFGIYAAALFVSVLFAASQQKFMELEEALCYDFIPGYPVSVIEREVVGMDLWAKRNHRAVGTLLAVCSLINLQLAGHVYVMLSMLTSSG